MPKQRKKRDGLSKKCDCPESRWLKCAHPWHWEWMHRRQRYRIVLDLFSKTPGAPMEKTEAKRIADDLRSKIRGGTFIDPRAPQGAIEAAEAAADARFTVGAVFTL